MIVGIAISILAFPGSFGARARVPHTPGSRAAGRTLAAEDVGQLLMVGFDEPDVTPDLKRVVGEWHVGGVVLYAQNVESPEQVTRLNQRIRSLATGRVAPFIAVDQEGGSVRRLREGVPQLPGAMALGATRSPALAREAGESLGASLRSLGFDMNFAPVLDVLSNPGNSALGTRVFSDDPQLVASLGSAFIQGELRGGVIPVGKHFPGQGGTAGDSHYGLPILDATLPEIRRREFVPFRAAFAAGLPAVMTAHIALPRIEGTSDLPATLSHRLLTDVLRNELGFRGLVVTDELQMRAVQGRRKIGEVAVEALLAGADMIMIVWDHRDREEIYAALKAAYASGKLPHAVVDRAVRHVLAAKAALASMAAASPPPSLEQQAALVERIAAKAMTLESPHGLGHIESSGRVIFIGPDGPLRKRLPSARWIPTPPRVDDEIVQHALKTAAEGRFIVAAIATENDHTLVVRLRRSLPATRLTVVCLGSPWLVAGIAEPDAILYAYSDLPPFQAAAARVLLDGAPAPGVLPIRSTQAVALP